MTKKREHEIVEEFNKFIKVWCKDSYPHLIDTDENDGEAFRIKLRDIVDREEKGKRGLIADNSNSVSSPTKKVGITPKSGREKGLSFLTPSVPVSLLERIDDMINLLFEDITKMSRDEYIKSPKTSERLALIQVKSVVVDVLKAFQKEFKDYVRDELLLDNSLLKEFNPTIHVVEGTLFQDFDEFVKRFFGDKK